MNLINEILKHEGVATIVTSGPNGPHVVATWNSYIEIMGDRLLIPAGMYHVTEANVDAGSSIQVMIGTKEVPGKIGPGTGVLITGTGEFLEGEMLEQVKGRFPWARAAFLVNVEKSEQLI